jgi:hypothetical protein
MTLGSQVFLLIWALLDNATDIIVEYSSEILERYVPSLKIKVIFIKIILKLN